MPSTKKKSEKKPQEEDNHAGEFSDLEPEKGKEKKKELSKRQEFHVFYGEVYLKEVNLLEPHHADKHGILGYEDNTLNKEVQSQDGKPENVTVFGLCGYCTKDKKSAKKEWEQN